jgi:hypothetical protein
MADSRDAQVRARSCTVHVPVPFMPAASTIDVDQRLAGLGVDLTCSTSEVISIK